jgi:hypothetical protein
LTSGTAGICRPPSIRSGPVGAPVVSITFSCHVSDCQAAGSPGTGLIVTGLARTMEPETRHLDPSARLRLVDVSLGAGRGQLRVGPGLTGVLTGSGNRAAAARFLATTVAGPRPPECDGSVDVDGEIISVRTLPEPLLAPGAPNLIDHDLLRGQWQAGSARRRDDLAATHASHRLEGYRLDAALERARLRGVTSGTSGDASGPARRGTARDAVAADTDNPFHRQLQILLADLDARPGGTLPEGILLADAWEAQTLLERVRQAVETDPEVDVDALERRVNDARAVVDAHTSLVPDDVAALIEDCHRVVVDTEAAAFAARRKERGRAIAEYEEAVAAELVALADAGIDSYASFEVMMEDDASRPSADDRIAARNELAVARAALDEAFQIPDVPTRAELAERDARMRTRAAELLGREAGDDPAFELRALRVESEARTEILEELAEALRDGGVEITGDVESTARAELGLEAPAAPGPAAPSGSPDEAELEQLQIEHQRALEAIEAELVRVDAAYHADLGRLATSDFARALEWVLATYRAGDLLNGQLPLVFDGALDGLAAAARDVSVRILAEANDLQAIVVSDDPEVLQSVAYAGGTLVRWPEPVADRSATAAPPSTQRSLG